MNISLWIDPIDSIIKRAVSKLSLELEAAKIAKDIESKRKQRYKNRVEKRRIVYLKLKSKGRKM